MIAILPIVECGDFSMGPKSLVELVECAREREKVEKFVNKNQFKWQFFSIFNRFVIEN